MGRSTLVLLAAVLATGGCQAERSRSQPLGRVDYSHAFQAGRSALLARNFSIASADAASGEIVSRPKQIDAKPDRLLGSSLARQIARMQIRTKDGLVYAYLRVDVQRQDVGAARMMQPVAVDTERPSLTPAEEAAAITAEQDQAWETTGRDHALERAILADLLRRLGKTAEQPGQAAPRPSE